MPNPNAQPASLEMLAQLSPHETRQLLDRCQAIGRNFTSLTPDEIAEWLDQEAPTAPEPEVDVLAEDWSDLEEFLDDTLQLSYKGSQYRLQAADIDTGLECQMLLGVGARLRAGGKPTARQRDRLEDAEETELFIRLLGGQQWTVEPIEATCPECGSPAGQLCTGVDETTAIVELAEPHPGRGTPDPHYDPDRDVWKQLHDERRSWAFVQHVGTTAIFWAAFGTVAALEFWKSGGRPKANPAPAAPEPKAPQDRKASTTASKTQKQASTSSTPRKRPAKRATPGPRS